MALVSRPLPGESVHGYLRRLAIDNGHSRLNVFLAAIGVSGNRGPRSGNAFWASLAKATCLETSAFEAMRWLPCREAGGRTLLTFLGGTFAPSFLFPRNGRFCPACARAGLPALDLWSLAYVVACPLHRCLLAEHCPACGESYDAAQATFSTSCRCGTRFDEVDSIEAPQAAIDLAHHVASKLGTQHAAGAGSGDVSNTVPAPFADLGPNDYLAYVDVLGKAATTLAVDDKPGQGTRYGFGDMGSQPATATAVDRIEAAAALMTAWPEAFERLFEEVAARPGKDGVPATPFATKIGRMLRMPPRGSDGLPLPLICEAVDRYRKRTRAFTRRRNVTTQNVAALRLHTLFNASTLATAVGSSQATKIHARVLRRVLEHLSAAEHALDMQQLVSLVRDRAIAWHGETVTLVSGHRAAEILEGSSKATLSGWEHPSLLPREGLLHGIRFDEKPSYRMADVQIALARMQAVARKVASTEGLVPLVSIGMRAAGLRTWYTKTHVLTDVMAGRVPVAALLDEPRLKDLFVDLERLAAASAASNPSLTCGAADFVALARCNEAVRHRFGGGATFSLEECRWLVRAGLVRVELEKTIVKNRSRPAVTRLYHLGDMTEIARRRSDGQSTKAEAAMLAETCDASAALAAARSEGGSLRQAARRLTAAGYATPNGAPWSHASVAKAISALDTGGVVQAKRLARPAADA